MTQYNGPTIRMPRPTRIITTACVVIVGVSMLVFGVWAWLAPYSFAHFTNFPLNIHFLHDAGVFQIGIGVGLLASIKYADAIAVTLTAFFIANTLHAVNHATDLHLGGHPSDALFLGTLSAIAGLALYLRVRFIGTTKPDGRRATHDHR